MIIIDRDDCKVHFGVFYEAFALELVSFTSCSLFSWLGGPKHTFSQLDEVKALANSNTKKS